jgi:hypothetical protein
MEEEIWKPIPSKPGVLASSFGRVLFPKRWAKMPNGGTRCYETKPTYGFLTKSSKTARYVYMNVYNKFYGNMKIHRLVCEAFHGLAKDKSHVVIHLDEDATNNRPENLKWGTMKENLNMPKFIEYCKSRTGDSNPYLKGKKAKSQ